MFNKKQKTYTSKSLNYEAWERFKTNKLSLTALIFVGLTVLVAILGYMIIPDSSPNCNNQIIEIAAKKPGYTVTLLKLPKPNQDKTNYTITKLFTGFPEEYTYIPISSYKIYNNILEYVTNTGNVGETGDTYKYTLSPSQLKNIDELIVKKTFLLGTDRFGRDMLSRLIIGMRISLAVGFISIIISLLIGITLGAIAGYFRGFIDDVIVWIINIIWSVPTLLLVIAITFALGKGFWQVFIAVGLTMWVEIARVVRGQVISIREKEYVEAAKALGFSHTRIIYKHILPNVMSIIIVLSAANFASAILIESGLSFLGIGVQPPAPSWGSMIREHYEYILLDNAYLALIPGFAIMFMVLAFMQIGNGLRDALDVKHIIQ